MLLRWQKGGVLASALEQAAAYVRNQPPGFGFAGYLRLFEHNERQMLEAGTRGATDYPVSVYLTWRTQSTSCLPARNSCWNSKRGLHRRPFQLACT